MPTSSRWARYHHHLSEMRWPNFELLKSNYQGASVYPERVSIPNEVFVPLSTVTRSNALAVCGGQWFFKR